MIKKILSDLDFAYSQLDDLKRIKKDFENLKIELESAKKEKTEEIQKITKEKNDQISNIEKIKLIEFNRKEDEYKPKLDKLKVELNQRNEINDKLKEECDLIRTQLELVEKNFENFKISKREQE
jgi:hypothetical protein